MTFLSELVYIFVSVSSLNGNGRRGRPSACVPTMILTASKFQIFCLYVCTAVTSWIIFKLTNGCVSYATIKGNKRVLFLKSLPKISLAFFKIGL